MRGPARSLLHRGLRPAGDARAVIVWAGVVVCAAFQAGVPAPVEAQSARVRTSVDTTLATVGDRITLTVTVEHAAGASVVWPDSLDLSPFEVIEATALAPEESEGSMRSKALFRLVAFELGELEIPSFGVSVLTADGGREELETDRYGVEIVSVGADETGDIRDIRGPLTIPLGLARVAGWVLALLALVLLAYSGYRRWSRRAAESSPARPGPPARPPHELALEALDELESSGMLERGEIKAYHVRVSDILRRYVEDRFAVPALEMTTWEVLAGLERVGIDSALRDDLRRFLEPCDLVKFAKVRPDVSASREVLRLGRALVQTSAPRPEPEPEARSEEAVEVGL